MQVTPAEAATGSINSTVLSGTPGDSVTVYGAGFTPGVTATTFFDSTTVVAPSIVQTGGDFTITFQVPFLATPGQHIISVQMSGGDTVSNTIKFIVVPGIVLYPTSGFVGDSVQISGGGFGANQSVSLYWDSNAIPFAALKANAFGIFGPSPITIPAASRGSHTVSTNVQGGGASATFTIGSRIAINPVSIASGDMVSITGTGFAPNGFKSIIILLDDIIQISDPISINTSSTGGFSAAVVIPQVSPGDHVLKAQDPGGSAHTVLTTTVKKIPLSLTLSSTTGVSGDVISISGNGFAANEKLNFTMDGGVIAINPATKSSDNSGAFDNVTLTIPALTSGIHVIRVSDQEGSYFTVNIIITVVVKVSITPTSGAVATQISIGASGFPGSAQVSIYWDNVPLAALATSASASGVINAITFNAPAGSYGPHTIKVQDGFGDQSSAVFSIRPKIDASPVSGVYGDTVAVNGSGFNAGSSVLLTIVSSSASFNLSSFSPASIVTNLSTDPNPGGFNASFKVGELSNGIWTLQAQDSSGNLAQANFAVKQNITMTPNAGVAGTSISVTGSGFASGKSITIKYGGYSIGTDPETLHSDGNGYFIATFKAPATAAGTLIIDASDGINSSSVSFSSFPGLSVDPVTSSAHPGSPGMSFTVSGTGFKVNSPITVSFDSSQINLTTITSDASGSFTVTATIPATPAGTHTIHVSDGVSLKDIEYFIGATTPAAPLLEKPAAGEHPKQPIAFSWSNVTAQGGVTYTLQISQDPNFSAVTIERMGLTTKTYTMTTAEEFSSSMSKTPYYWRVRATDSAGNPGTWSSAYSFTLGSTRPGWIVYIWVGLGVLVTLALGFLVGSKVSRK